MGTKVMISGNSPLGVFCGGWLGVPRVSSVSFPIHFDGYTCIIKYLATHGVQLI